MEVTVVMSIDDVGGICSTDVCAGLRRCNPVCVRVGVVNGLLLRSFSRPLLFDVNCLAVNVEPKSLVGFLLFF